MQLPAPVPNLLAWNRKRVRIVNQVVNTEPHFTEGVGAIDRVESENEEHAPTDEGESLAHFEAGTKSRRSLRTN